MQAELKGDALHFDVSVRIASDGDLVIQVIDPTNSWPDKVFLNPAQVQGLVDFLAVSKLPEKIKEQA